MAPAFGTVAIPVRSRPEYPIEVHNPAGFPSDYPPGDLWWVGMHDWWTTTMPPSLTRCTSVLVNPLCRMPWLINRPDGSAVAPGDPGYPAWILDPALLNGSTGGPNIGRFAMLDRMDRFDLWSRWIRDALWFGVGVLAFTPDAAGQPVAGSVQVLHPSRIYRGDNGWALSVNGHVEPIDDDGMVLGQRILLLRHSLPGGVLGWHAEQIRLANRLTQYASETFDSAVPSGVLSTDQPVTQKQADSARTEWETRQQRRSIAVLGNGNRYQQVTMTPVDAEVVALNNLSNEQIAHSCELPAWYADASSDSGTYTNSLQWRQDLVDGPLASWSARLEETLGSLLPWGWSMSVDFRSYTTPTTPNQPPSPAPEPPALPTSEVPA